MCEYCGCQALASIELLTREHDVVRDLAEQTRRAVEVGDLGNARLLAEAVARVLGPHTEVEERGLFPAMAREFPDHIDALQAEHRLIEEALAESSGEQPAEGWPSRLAAAMRTLCAHAFKEQDGVFPAALSTLDASDWDHVDAVRREVGSPVG